MSEYISPLRNRVRTRPQAKDKRARHRIPLDRFDLVAVLQPQALTSVTMLCDVLDVSAGGCCLGVPAGALEMLAAGTHCTVQLPVTKQGVWYPATVVSIESPCGLHEQVVLRLRFRRSEPVAQKLLTRWVGALSIQAWHV